MLSLFTSVLLALSQSHPATQQNVLFDQRQSNLAVLIPSGIPVSVDSAAIREPLTDCTLSFHIENRSDESLKQVRISFEVYNPNTRQVRSESEDVANIAPHSGADRSDKLMRCPQRDDRLVLVVQEAESETSLWKVESWRLFAAVRDYMQGKRYSLPKASWWVVKK